MREIWQKVYHASSFGSHVLLTAGTNTLLALVGLITGVLAARLLGPQGRGELAAIQTWPSFIATMAMLGLSEALVYFSAREPDRAGRYWGSAMALALLVSLPFMAVGYLALPVCLSAQSLDVIAAARWYLLLVPLYALVGMPLHPLQGRNDLAVWNVLRVMPAVGWLATLMVAWFLGRRQPQFVAVSYLAVLAMLFFPIIYIVTRRVPGLFWPDFSTWGRLLRYGLPSVLSGIPQMLNLRLDQMLMTAFLPAQVLGLYVVAVAWSGAIQPLISALGSVLFPRVASQKTLSQQNHTFAQGSRLGALLSVTMAITLMIVTPVAMPLLFGKEFTPAIPVTLILIIAGAVAGLNQILEGGLRGLGYPTKVVKAEFGGLVMTVILLLLLLRPIGIMGAALASLLSYSTVTILLMAKAQRLTGRSLLILLRPTCSEIQSSWKHIRTLTEVTSK